MNSSSTWPLLEAGGGGGDILFQSNRIFVITTHSLIYLDFQNLKFNLKCNHVAISR